MATTIQSVIIEEAVINGKPFRDLNIEIFTEQVSMFGQYSFQDLAIKMKTSLNVTAKIHLAELSKTSPGEEVPLHVVDKLISNLIIQITTLRPKATYDLVEDKDFAKLAKDIKNSFNGSISLASQLVTEWLPAYLKSSKEEPDLPKEDKFYTGVVEGVIKIKDFSMVFKVEVNGKLFDNNFIESHLVAELRSKFRELSEKHTKYTYTLLMENAKFFQDKEEASILVILASQVKVLDFLVENFEIGCLEITDNNLYELKRFHRSSKSSYQSLKDMLLERNKFSISELADDVFKTYATLSGGLTRDQIVHVS